MKGNWKYIKWGLIIALIVISCLYQISDYPRMWYDEGVFSMVAANLATYRHYATTIISGHQFLDFDPGITTGPTLILPVAAMYMLFGVNILSGRLVSIVYLAGFLIMFYLLAKKLFGEDVALLSFVSIFLTRFILIPLKWGRFVMGEVPAIFFLLLGLFLHSGAEESSRKYMYVLAGLAYGLSILTKEYVILFLFPALLLDLILSKRRMNDTFLMLFAAMIPVTLFYCVKFSLLGGVFITNTLGKGSFIEEFFSPSFIPFNTLFSIYITVPIVIALALFKKIRGRNFSGAESLLLLIVIFDVLFFLVSAYIARLALFLVISNILLAYYLLDISWVKNKIGQIFAVLALISIFIVTSFLYANARNSSENNHDLMMMKSYLEINVPAGKVIETPEYEVAALSWKNTFYMPLGMMPTRDPKKMDAFRKYDFVKSGAPYYLEGDFARGLYSVRYTREKVGKYYREQKKIGRYILYRRKGA